MKVWSRDYDAQYLLRVNCFLSFEYSAIWIVPHYYYVISQVSSALQNLAISLGIAILRETWTSSKLNRNKI